ncbi:MAG TPA: response regulator [Kofleriaceae bacterium]|nr:response regulator [Kofleriaceae bacterium]
MSPHNHVNLLVVEDNEVDREALRRAFKRHGVHQPMIDVDDGVEALAVLRGERDLPLGRPYLILLDLNMPRMNGLELLGEIRRDPRLKDSVVFVLTTSRADEDKAAAYGQNVAGYLVKGDLGQNFAGLLELITAYCKVVELPVARA